MSARARIRRRWRAFIRPGGGRAFSSQSLLQFCQQALPTRHSPRVRPSAGHHTERKRFQISRLKRSCWCLRPRCCSHQQARNGQARTARGSHPHRPAKLCTPNTTSGQLRPSTSRLTARPGRPGRAALCERGGVETDRTPGCASNHMQATSRHHTRSHPVPNASRRVAARSGPHGFARGRGVTHIVPPTAWQMWPFLGWPQMPHLYFERPVLFFSAALDIVQPRPSPNCSRAGCSRPPRAGPITAAGLAGGTAAGRR